MVEAGKRRRLGPEWLSCQCLWESWRRQAPRSRREFAFGEVVGLSGPGHRAGHGCTSDCADTGSFILDAGPNLRRRRSDPGPPPGVSAS